METNIEIIDIEEFTLNNKPIPEGKRYKIKIDKKKYTVDEECMTGTELLKLANKIPVERYQLNQKIRGGQVTKISYDEKVCFTTPGIERFMTLPLDQTEG